MSIFVAIPTLKDPDIFNTIVSAFNNADDPSSVFVGVAAFVDEEFYQELSQRTSKIDNLIIDRYDFEINTGTGIGRTYAKLGYDGQDNFLQVDSHTHFEKGWDTILRKLWTGALRETGNEKTVVSGYLPGYTLVDGRMLKLESLCGYSMFTNNKMCTPWNRIRWIDLPMERFSMVTKTFVPAMKISGTFILSDHHYADFSGHVPYMRLYDEEIIQSIELFAAGYALVFPNCEIPLLHHYAGPRQTGRSTAREMEESIDRYMLENPEKCRKWERYTKTDLTNSSFQKWYIPNTYTGE